MDLLFVGVGLVSGNLTYQVFGAQDWNAAIDHSYWQLTTLVVVWFVRRFS